MKTQKNNNRQCSGFTLLEVIIALTISGIVITLLMLLLSDSSKGIIFQNKRVKKVQTMILYKKRIDSVIRNIKLVKIISDTYCEVITHSDSLVTIKFNNTNLHINNIVSCNNVKSFKFSTKENCEGKTVLLWECTPETGGWIGGGAIVYSGDQQ